MVEKIHNGPWPAKTALGEKLPALGVEILAFHPSLGRTKDRSRSYPDHRAPSFTGGADIESFDGQLKPYVDSSSDG